MDSCIHFMTAAAFCSAGGDNESNKLATILPTVRQSGRVFGPRDLYGVVLPRRDRYFVSD
jgi:hypothetical protein